jgi:nicotinamidase-related amidase
MKIHPASATGENAVLCVVDLQEKLLAAIHDAEAVTAEAVRVIRATRLLEVPITVTQQYTKGIGPTAPAVAEALGAFEPIEKLDFSAARAAAVRAWLEESGRSHVIVVGIEAHVCVLQTALDLVAAGYFVHVPANATGSRRPLDASAALYRMARAGVTVTTSEAVIFELLGTADHPRFKDVHRLVK